MAATIAWKYISPSQKIHIAKLLRQAPSCLKDIIGNTKKVQRAFIRASIFPDVVRHASPSCKRYNHPDWHYINQYWGNKPRAKDNNPKNVVNVLQALQKKWHNGTANAVDLAWIIHLTADIHQPLHVASRVSESSPYGDKGGNAFRLNFRRAQKGLLSCRICVNVRNLHAYWDKVLSFAPYRKGYKNTVKSAHKLEQRYHNDLEYRSIQVWQPEKWAQEGLNIVKNKIYPPRLQEGSWPDARYQQMATDIAGRALLLSAYRLARTLNQ